MGNYATTNFTSFWKMKKEELHRNIMQAVELIEDGSPRQAKELLVELANRITFT